LDEQFINERQHDLVNRNMRRPRKEGKFLQYFSSTD